MQTIVIVLNPGKLKNPDMDLCYCVPERLEEALKGAVQDNGYDFIDTEPGRPGPLMGVWLRTACAAREWPRIVQVFQEELFLDNNLSDSAEIFISEEDTAGLEDCTRIFPA